MNKNNFRENFISREQKFFKFKIGKVLASSLSGFIAGAIFASIISWVFIAIFIFYFSNFNH